MISISNIRGSSSGWASAHYLRKSQQKLSSTLEKLSSGFRINRAADDAAGLAVSEKMRMQITGLSQAGHNSHDGIRLIQIGEGALAEIHDMLNRAAELADTSANGTYQDKIDRESLQGELDQLCTEIDRIAKNVNFNGIRLFQNKGYTYETSASYVLNHAKETLEPASIQAGNAAVKNRNFTETTADRKTAVPAALSDGNPFLVSYAGVGGVTPRDAASGSTWDDVTKTLTISKAGTYYISSIAANGRIKIADGIGDVELKLTNVTCDVSAIDGAAALDIGQNNNVSITSIGVGGRDYFKSGSGCAGIAVGKGSHLTIDGNSGTQLEAEGGSNAAGIGSSYNQTDNTGSVTIKGGTIFAVGGINEIDGGGGAAIGAGYKSNFGNITIEGGRVSAHNNDKNIHNDTQSNSNGAAGIGAAGMGHVGDIVIKGGTVFATGGYHGAGIGGGSGFDGDKKASDPGYASNSFSTTGKIQITGGTVTATGGDHGAGIGTGCESTSGEITIGGGANPVTVVSKGGSEGAGIGSGMGGLCNGVKIQGKVDIQATGGTCGAGIGSGTPSWEVPAGIASRVTFIEIDADADSTIVAKGGGDIDFSGSEQVPAGIGSGMNEYNEKFQTVCDKITIKQGIITAIGGIGAVGDSKSICGDITIGEAGEAGSNKKIVIHAVALNEKNVWLGSFNSSDHSTPGKLVIEGNNTSIKVGEAGEGANMSGSIDAATGKFTSGAVDGAGKPIYAYPLYLQFSDQPLDAGQEAPAQAVLPLPKGISNLKITAVGKDGTTKTWTSDLSHAPLDDSYDFLWMTGQDQTLTLQYDYNGDSCTTELDLKFENNVFRCVAVTGDKPERPVDPDDPFDPSDPSWPSGGSGGILLQIGAKANEFMTVPRFYLSAKALKLETLNISTQENAWKSMPVLQEAINRVSEVRGSYGALAKRLEHNVRNLSVSAENIQQAESLIRDADVADEMKNFTLASILSQSAQAMLTHSNQDAQQVLQLLS